MFRHSKQVIILVLVVLLLSACNETSLPALQVPATIPGQDPASASPGVKPPTHTSLSSTDAPPSTSTLPAAEDVNTDQAQDPPTVMETNLMNIQIGNQILSATLVNNSSVAALKEALRNGPITINMRDYGGMEKVGSLGMNLPRNDQQITTEAGDIILYQGNALVIYYAPNSWNFTRLGKITDLSAAELIEILGGGDITITISLPQD